MGKLSSQTLDTAVRRAAQDLWSPRALGLTALEGPAPAPASAPTSAPASAPASAPTGHATTDDFVRGGSPTYREYRLDRHVPGQTVHVLAAGETVSGVAAQHGLRWSDGGDRARLRAANTHIADFDHVLPGTEVVIPPRVASSSGAPAPPRTESAPAHGAAPPRTESAADATRTHGPRLDDAPRVSREGAAGSAAARPAPSLLELASSRRYLDLGARGDSVNAVQERLVAQGYLPARTPDGASPVDGVYGRTTKAAVWNYQRDHGITPSGLVGQSTVEALFPRGVPAPKTETAPAPKTETAPPPNTGTPDVPPTRPYLPVIEGFVPGVDAARTRDIAAAEARLDARIAEATTPAARAELEAERRQWQACSFHTTRRAAEIAGVSYERMLAETGDPHGGARPGFGAWHKRGVVLARGGESVWQRGEGDVRGAYGKVQLGDFVSIGNGQSSREAVRYPDLAYEEGVRHSGIVVGRNDAGVPIVEHSVKGTVYREPIDDLSRSGMGYQAVSVFRAANLRDGEVTRAREQADTARAAVRTSWDGAAPFSGEVKLADPQERAAVERYVGAYQGVRKDLGALYGVTPEHLDRSFRDLQAIGVQESNFDNDVVRTSKGGVVAKLGDQAKQWLTSETSNPLQAALRDGVRRLRDERDAVTPAQAAENAEYNRAHGLKPNVAAWRKEAEIAARMRSSGLGYDEVARQVNGEYGRSESVYQPSALRSHGAYKIKEVPAKALAHFGPELGADPERFFATPRGNVAAGLALYEQNYARAQRLFPESSIPRDLGWGAREVDEFYRQVAVLAHNAPSKAFNKDYVDFYIAPVLSGRAGDKNPDRARFGADYLRQVDRYRAELWG